MDQNKIQNAIEVIKKQPYTKGDAILKILHTTVLTKETLKQENNANENILDGMNPLKDAKWLGENRKDNFKKIYNAVVHLTNEETIQIIYDTQIDKRGNVAASSKWFVEKCFAHIDENMRTALICDCDLYDSSLFEKIKSYRYINFTLTTQNPQYAEVYKVLYGELKNVEVIHSDVFDDDFSHKTFDFISCITLNHRESGARRKKDGIPISYETGVIDNLTKHTTQNEKAIFVTSSKFIYGTTRTEKNLKNTLTKKFNILEAGDLPRTFLTGISDKNTFIFVLSKNTEPEITKIISYNTNNKNDNAYYIEHEKPMSQIVFSKEFEWNIPKILILDDAAVKKFYESETPKASLKDVTLDVFAGRNTKATTHKGKIKFVNISDIKDGKINYANLDGLDDSSRKLKPYVLHTGDVLLTTKGTTIKTAVFEQQPIDCIPSANITVIRPNDMILGEYLRLFLESTVGKKLLQSIVRGGWLLNISRRDLETIDVPVPDLSTQQELIDKYNRGFEAYTKAISDAKKTWQTIKQSVEDNLF